MKERPILFNTAMVQEILSGRKTQTRRAVKPQPSAKHNWHGWIIESTCRKDEGKACWAIGQSPLLTNPHRVKPPFGKVGDRLWVRESFRLFDASDECCCADFPCNCPRTGTPVFRASHDDGESKWKPSIHMPRSACRIILEITSVRVERLQDITEADAKAEGFDYPAIEQAFKFKARHNFKFQWDLLYKNWSENPWVWVLEFKVLTTNGKVQEVAA